MEPENLNLSLGTIFSLKHIILKSFHSVPLDLGINRTQERILMMCSHHENPTMQSLSRQGHWVWFAANDRKRINAPSSSASPPKAEKSPNASTNC